MCNLVISSSFTNTKKNEEGIRIPCIIDNNNNFLNNLKKILTKRDCILLIAGNPKKERDYVSLNATIKGFEMSGIAFKEYIYVDDTNKRLIKEYIKKADCIDLYGGHLPTCNAFIEELNLRELVKNYKGVIMGASGGGMNLADSVYCIPEVSGEPQDPNFKRYLKGCALTNINIIPHFQFFKNMEIDGLNMLNDILLPDSNKSPLIAIPDGSYIIKENNMEILFGEAYLLNKGELKQICENNKTINLTEFMKKLNNN